MDLRTRTDRAARAALLGAVLLAGALPYATTLRTGFGFTLDDANTILGHKGVQGALSFEDIVLRDWWGRSRFDSIGTWRPLATLSFWLDEHLGAGSPRPFHATNLVLYLALLATLDGFLRRWCGKALGRGARTLAVVAFGALAIHADVVPSPTGRAELLAALLSLGALAAATCGRILGLRHAVLALALLFAALLSKESAAPMAVLVPLLAHRMHFARRTYRRSALILVAVGSPLVLGAVVAFRALEMPFMELGPERALENPLLAVNALHRWQGALEVLALYVHHALVGSGLAPDYSFAEPPLLRSGAVPSLAGGALLLALAVLGAATWRRAPRIADAVVAFGASYLTVSNVVVAASAIADRLFFFPSMWLGVVVALVGDRVVRGIAARRVVGAFALAFVVFQTARAQAYAELWRDDVTLLGAAARAYPDVFRTQRNLAHALSDAGDAEGAAWHLTVAEAIYSSYPEPPPPSAFPEVLEIASLSAHIATLRVFFGPRAACDAIARARARLDSWDDRRAAGALAAAAESVCSAR